ncbi:MAG: BC1881 family protein [Anaerovoracaceae bacterium]
MDRKMSEISTKDIVEELSSRTGVEKIIISAYEGAKFNVEGPMIILKVVD